MEVSGLRGRKTSAMAPRYFRCLCRLGNLIALGGALSALQAAQIMALWPPGPGSWRVLGGRDDAVAGGFQRGEEAWGWGGKRLWRWGDGRWSAVAEGAETLRAAVALPDGTVVCLAGGEVWKGQLGAAKVVFWRPDRGWWTSNVAFSRVNPFLLRVGQVGTQVVVLVGVRKTAIFDPVYRARPFIYSYSPSRQDLVPRWQGTTFARPYLEAVFADLGGTGRDLVCALEAGRDGQRMVATYEWSGHGVSAVAESPPRQLGDRLDVWPGTPERVVVWEKRDEGWRALALELGDQPGDGAVGRLEVTWVTRTVRERPRAWAVVPVASAPGAAVAVLDGRGQVVQLPWLDAAEEP